MGVDIRLPIGGMFSILGAVLFVYGLFTRGQEMYARSLGYNVNIWWGLAMLIFGAIMLGLALTHKKSAASAGPSDRGDVRRH